MARILKTNTAVILTVGPFLAITDGLTLKTGMTVTNMAMNMWHEHDDGSAPTKSIDAVSFTASAGNNDMVELAAGFYSIEITAAQINFLGRAKFQIYDVDLVLPYFEDWLVVPAVVYDAITGGANGVIPTNVISLATNAVTADAVKADAVTKIQSGLSTSTSITDISSRLPAALVAGKIDANASVSLTSDDIQAIIAGLSGGGDIVYTGTFEYPAGTPIPGAEVHCCTDSAGQSIIATTVTNDFGSFLFYLAAGTYYIAIQHPAYQNSLTEITVS